MSSVPRSQSPLVTVLLPTFNSARYLAEAIESVLAQSCGDLDLVVADGGSTDATVAIVNAYAALDSRVRVESFPALHPTRRVDLCIARSSAKYIALQHADDLSYGHRLASQLQAFAKDDSLAVCSAGYRSFWHERTSAGREGTTVHSKPESHEQIKSQLLFWWVMHAPTLVLDRLKIQAQNLRFENEFLFINDYWQTVTHIDRLRYHNVPEELSAYRLHPQGDGSRHLDRLMAEQSVVKERILRHFGFSFTPRQLELHKAIRLLPDGQLSLTSKAEHQEVLDWLQLLGQQNDSLAAFDHAIFSQLLDDLTARIDVLRSAATD